MSDSLPPAVTELIERQTRILRALLPEYSGHYFICGEGGDKDANGLPDRIMVCAAYGSDAHSIYERVK